jgi:hypothetical protein
VEALVVKAQPQATFQAMSRRNALTVASALSDDIGEQLRREQLVGVVDKKGVHRSVRDQVAAPGGRVHLGVGSCRP